MASGIIILSGNCPKTTAEALICQPKPEEIQQLVDTLKLKGVTINQTKKDKPYVEFLLSRMSEIKKQMKEKGFDLFYRPDTVSQKKPTNRQRVLGD